MFVPNPYRPGTGVTPSYLAGRENILKESEKLLRTVSMGYPVQPVIFYGLRGVGKTVLLSRLSEIAESLGVISDTIEVPEKGQSFQKKLVLKAYKIIRRISKAKKVEGYIKKALGILGAFALKYSDGSISAEIEVSPLRGTADTGDLENDISELFVAIGEIAKKNDVGVTFFFDEIQYLTPEDMEALFTALHRVGQKGLPLMVFGAGLPKILKMAGDIKSYAERLFRFEPIGALPVEAASLAITEPARILHVAYEKEALSLIINETGGYPYFLQEYGNCLWNEDDMPKTISLKMVQDAKALFHQSLDNSFFLVRYSRATPREIQFMLAMADCGELPCTIRQVAEIMQAKVKSISVLRAQLIHKGFIYDSSRGEIDFTVPQFDAFLKRTANYTATP